MYYYGWNYSHQRQKCQHNIILSDIMRWTLSFFSILFLLIRMGIEVYYKKSSRPDQIDMFLWLKLILSIQILLVVYLYPHIKTYLHTYRHASINYIVNIVVYILPPPKKVHSGTNSTKWNFKARKKGDKNEAIEFGQDVTEHLLVIQGEWETRERLISAK